MAAGFNADAMTVTVNADPPPRLLGLRADRVRVQATNATFRGLEALDVDLILHDVRLLDRTFGSIEGTLRHVTTTDGSGAGVTIPIAVVSGTPDRIQATMTFPASDAEELAADAVRKAIGLAPSRVVLTAPDRVRVEAGGLAINARITVDAQGVLKLVPPSGAPIAALTLFEPGPDAPYTIESFRIARRRPDRRGHARARPRLSSAGTLLSCEADVDRASHHRNDDRPQGRPSVRRSSPRHGPRASVPSKPFGASCSPPSSGTTRRRTSSRSAARSTSRSRPTPARPERRASRTSPTRSHRPRSWPTSESIPIAVQAALLHDVPEDTEFSLDDIEERFGAEVAHLVDGVTKLSKFSTHTHEQQQAENIRKMFLAMAEDIRVVLIKLADRLHNMRTLAALPLDKQQRIARQTMEIYAPLAERLGIWQIKWELEDLAFKALEPERFRELAKLLDTRRKGREGFIEAAIAELRPALTAAGIEAELQGRPKHIYSIYKKMQRKGAGFEEIYDVYAIRCLVEEVKDCYAALGVVHSIWRPIPGQFDDYIAVPKNNLYQSLHTAVIVSEGKPLEIQIRTHAMHQVSEVGIAAHWRYKEGSRSDREYDAKLAWLRQLMDWQREVSDATEFVEGIKLDIFQDQVFVFTPRGDVKDLPAGSTPLDFAYRIHTDVGHRCIGAKVNNRLVPLDYRLKNGDIVEIVTTKGEHGPSRDWLNVVRTSHAREKIRAWFKRQERDDNIVHGRESLERELRRLARTSIQAVGLDKIVEVGKQYNYDSLDDFYAAIGYGAVGAQQVVMRLGVVDDAELALPTVAPSNLPQRTGGVRVKGVGDLLVRFARCCHPIPGDPIQGFITRGKGVTVHLRSCPDRDERARGQPADRRRVGGDPDPDLPDRDPDRGVRSDRVAVRHHPGGRRGEGQHRRRQRERDAGPHGGRDRDAPGGLGQPARPGHGPDRAAQGRDLGPARPRLSGLTDRLVVVPRCRPPICRLPGLAIVGRWSIGRSRRPARPTSA